MQWIISFVVYFVEVLNWVEVSHVPQHFQQLVGRFEFVVAQGNM